MHVALNLIQVYRLKFAEPKVSDPKVSQTKGCQTNVAKPNCGPSATPAQRWTFTLFAHELGSIQGLERFEVFISISFVTDMRG